MTTAATLEKVAHKREKFMPSELMAAREAAGTATQSEASVIAENDDIGKTAGD